MATVAINGLGRIGRATLKVLTGLDDIHIAAIRRRTLYCLLSRRRRGHMPQERMDNCYKRELW